MFLVLIDTGRLAVLILSICSESLHLIRFSGLPGKSYFFPISLPLFYNGNEVGSIRFIKHAILHIWPVAVIYHSAVASGVLNVYFKVQS